MVNPDIKIWDFRKLAQKAISIINADWPIDLSKTWIKEIEKVNNSEYKKIDYIFFEKAFKGWNAKLNRVKLKIEDAKRKGDQKEKERLRKEQIPYLFQEDILRMMNIRNNIKSYFLKINKLETPWEISLIRLQEEETENKLLITLEQFIDYYSWLTEVFIERDNKYIKTRAFSTKTKDYHDHALKTIFMIQPLM